MHIETSDRLPARYHVACFIGACLFSLAVITAAGLAGAL